MRTATQKRPRVRIIRLVIDGLPPATCVCLKPWERGNAPGLRRWTLLGEVRSAASASFSGYAPLRGGLSVYIGPNPAWLMQQEAITIWQNEGSRAGSMKIKLLAQLFIRAYQKCNIATEGTSSALSSSGKDNWRDTDLCCSPSDNCKGEKRDSKRPSLGLIRLIPILS